MALKFLSVAKIAGECGLVARDLSLLYALPENNLDGVQVGVKTVAQVEGGVCIMKHEPLSQQVFGKIQGSNVKEKEFCSPANW